MAVPRLKRIPIPHDSPIQSHPQLLLLVKFLKTPVAVNETRLGPWGDGEAGKHLQFLRCCSDVAQMFPDVSRCFKTSHPFEHCHSVKSSQIQVQKPKT